MKSEIKRKIKIDEDRYVAYIDILGFKDLVEHNINNNIFVILLDRILEKIQKKRFKKFFIDKVDIKLIGDAIIVSLPINDLNLASLVLGLSVLQYSLIMNGILVRGGIEKGKFIRTKNTLISDGLINAYLLENAYANYPRIILPDNLTELCIQELKEINVVTNDTLTKADELVLFSDDDFSYINYAYIITEPKTIFYSDYTPDDHKHSVELLYVKAKNARKPPRVFEKLNWLVNYHNKFVKTYNSLNSSDYKEIDINNINISNVSDNPFDDFNFGFIW